MHYGRYLDRPEISGHARLDEERKKVEDLRQHRGDLLKDWGWQNRYRLIGISWATTMGAVIWKDFNNPLLNSVHKFGHARLWSQAVTIAAVIAAFGMSEESGLWSKKYEDPQSREKALDAPYQKAQ